MFLASQWARILKINQAHIDVISVDLEEDVFMKDIPITP
jgi:hypothetical protein